MVGSVERHVPMVGSLEWHVQSFDKRWKKMIQTQHTNNNASWPGSPPSLPLANPTNTTVTRGSQAMPSHAKAFLVSLNTRLEPGCLLPLLRAKLACSDAFLYIRLAVASSSSEMPFTMLYPRHDHTHTLGCLGPSSSFTTYFGNTWLAWLLNWRFPPPW